MLSSVRTSAALAATLAALAATVSPAALAQDAARTLADNEGVLIDGKALTITAARAKGDVASQIGNLSARPLGPGAIVFRSGDRLYMIDGGPMGATQALNDPYPGSDRQRSYGGLNDPYPGSDRQRSYGGLYDPYPGRSPALYGGLYDPYPNSDYRGVDSARTAG